MCLKLALSLAGASLGTSHHWDGSLKVALTCIRIWSFRVSRSHSEVYSLILSAAVTSFRGLILPQDLKQGALSVLVQI